MRPTLSIAATLVLAACSADRPPPPEQQSQPASQAPATVAPTETAPPAADAAEPKLAVDGEGLRWFLPESGSARPLAFGLPQAEVLASLERVRGAAGQGTNQDCGAGPVQYANWPDGLSIVFQNGKFAGWGLDRRAEGAITTASGVGPGSTRSALEDAYQIDVRQSSLGTEFSTGGFHGLFDGAGPDARITDMWAGVSCVAR